VLVEGECPPPASPEVEIAGIVGITDYHPKFVKMSVNATVPAVLLFNDKFDAGWKAWVDGQPATILKANFLMRGLHVPAGAHEVIWRFEPPSGGLYVSLAAIGVGLLLTGLTIVRERKAGTTADSK
jgi:uncharacterized membrane protein YfhO